MIIVAKKHPLLDCEKDFLRVAAKTHNVTAFDCGVNLAYFNFLAGVMGEKLYCHVEPITSYRLIVRRLKDMAEDIGSHFAAQKFKIAIPGGFGGEWSSSLAVAEYVKIKIRDDRWRFNDAAWLEWQAQHHGRAQKIYALADQGWGSAAIRYALRRAGAIIIDVAAGRLEKYEE